jgi:3-isopropylmalate dehydrogenase
MLVDASPLKREVVEGTDLMVIRELTGVASSASPGVERFADGGARAINTMAYTSREVERIARIGFDVARKRRHRLTSVDKVNVLVVSQLWREVVTKGGREYPDVTLDHVLVDNCAMALVHRPTQFDTIVTENTFGDILSDEAAILAGSMGMLPSASLGGSVGLYEPVHGTAPTSPARASPTRSRRFCRRRCSCGIRSAWRRTPIGSSTRCCGCSSRDTARRTSSRGGRSRPVPGRWET